MAYKPSEKIHDSAVPGEPQLDALQKASSDTDNRGRSTASWIGTLLILVLLTEEAAYAFNLVVPAFPSMAKAFPGADLAWIATIYTLSGAIGAPIAGKLADRYGKKRLVVATAALMSVGSLVVAVAPNFAMVLVGRAIEGIGIAVIPLVYSLMRDTFPRRLLPMAVSVTVGGVGITSLTGPILAGYLIDNFGYASVFWFLAIYPAVLGVAVMLFVPESPLRAPMRVDFVGALLLGAGFAALLFTISNGSTWGWASGPILTCAAVTALLLIGWVIYSRKAKEPLIELSLIRSRGVVTTMVAQFGVAGFAGVVFIVLSYVVQTPASLGLGYGFGGSAATMAWVTIPGGLLSVAAGFLVGYLSPRQGPRFATIMGFLCMAAGAVVLASFHSDFSVTILSYCVTNFGAGLAMSSIPNLVIEVTPAAYQAVTATTVNVMGALGGGIFVQICFAVLANNVGTVVEGTPQFSDLGITTVYYIAGGAAALGLVGALFAPRRGPGLNLTVGTSARVSE